MIGGWMTGTSAITTQATTVAASWAGTSTDSDREPVAVGGAIVTPGYDYVDFLMPGIIVQTIAFGGFVTALGLSEDLRKGLIDRFRSLPMARGAVLTGRTIADLVQTALTLVVLAVVALASPAFAQGGGASSTGSISGEIKDAQGGVLPGVTVTVSSPNLQGSRTEVTDGDGKYTIPAIPPGTYRAEYSWAGETGTAAAPRRTTGDAQLHPVLSTAAARGAAEAATRSTSRLHALTTTGDQNRSRASHLTAPATHS